MSTTSTPPPGSSRSARLPAGVGAVLLAALLFGATTPLVKLHEPFGWRLVVAGALMALGLWLHLSERHEHEHHHESMEHSHLHAHDDGDLHHQHTHDDDAPPLIGGRHIHMHRHEPMTHRHAHTPDLHHRHGHADGP